jgi:iron(III) transport system ATP-binding protein
MSIGVMNEGLIQQWDTPYNLYHQPKNRFVADFIGQGTLVPGKVLNSPSGGDRAGGARRRLCRRMRWRQLPRLRTGAPVEVLIRPDDIIHDDHSPMLAEIERKAFRGAEFLYTLKLGSGAQVLAQVPSHHDHSIGEMIGIRLNVEHVVAFKTRP